MKKLFSILCALAVMLSASAAPQMSKKDLDNQVKKESRFQKAAPFKSMPNTKAVALHAPKAVMETIDITIADNVTFTDYCATDGWWQFQAQNTEYYVTLSNLDGVDSPDGTYDYSVMDPDYTSVVVLANEEEIAFTAGSVTITTNEAGDATAVGSFTGDDGNTYNINLTYTAPVVPEGGDFEIVTLSERFYSSDNDVWVNMYDADGNRFRFDIVVAEGETALTPGTTYTLDDMLADYSYATVAGTTINYVSATLVKTLNADESGDINASFVDANGNTWNLHYAIPAAPTVQGTATITATNLEVDDAYVSWFGAIYLDASNTTHTVSITLYPTSTTDYAGNYALDSNNSISIVTGGQTIKGYSGTITLTQVDGAYAVSGAVLCWDNIEYTLDLTYVIPDKTREASITMTGLELSLFNGGWQLMGFNDDETMYVSVAAYADAVAGTYTADNLALDYCYVYTGLEFDDQGQLTAGTQYKMKSGNLTVTYNEADQTIQITGTMLCTNADNTDVPEFTVNLAGGVPEPTEQHLQYDSESEGFDEVFALADAQINTSYLAEYHALTVQVKNASNAMVALLFYVAEDATGLTPGTYTINSTEAAGTVMASTGVDSQGSVSMSLAGYTDAEGYLSTVWFMVAGTVTVSQNGEIVVDALNSYAQPIYAQILNGTAVDNVAAEAAAVKMVKDGQMIIKVNGQEFNAQGQIVK